MDIVREAAILTGREVDEPLIHVEGLTRRFGTRTAVDRLDFDVPEGEILGLLGPNGAGKTTTIRMLAGMIAPSEGSVRIAGFDPAREPERVHEVIGLLPESPGLYDRLSAKENLGYFARFYAGLDVAAAVDGGLRRMGLEERRHDRVATFSKGMKQRLALARALLHRPRILFLDEPTAGLDPEAARALRMLILDLRGEGRTVLLSTHNLAEAEAICDRIAIFRTRLIAIDSPQALREQRFQPRVRIRVAGDAAAAREALVKLPFVRAVSADVQDATLLLATVDDADRDRPRIAARLVEVGAELLEISAEQRTLEDLYLDLVEEAAQ